MRGRFGVVRGWQFTLKPPPSRFAKGIMRDERVFLHPRIVFASKELERGLSVEGDGPSLHVRSLLEEGEIVLKRNNRALSVCPTRGAENKIRAKYGSVLKRVDVFLEDVI